MLTFENYTTVIVTTVTIALGFAKLSASVDLLASDRLCPDLTLNGNREDRLYLRQLRQLQVVSIPVLGLIRSNNGDVPCRTVDVLSSYKSHGLIQVAIRAAHVSATPWNFTGSGDCRTFIKFRTNDVKLGNQTRLCRMYRVFNSESIGYDNITNLTPAIWTIPKNRIGLSGMGLRTNASDNDSDEPEKEKYLQIVYKSLYAGSQCILTVQQHSIGNSSVAGKDCDTSRMKHQLCGTYHCSDQRKILSKLGFLPFDGITDFDTILGAYLNPDGKSNLKGLEVDIFKNYDIELRDGELYFKPKISYQAALFRGMTRGISFLFILSVLISCVSYQLKPYLRPSSSFDMDMVRERSHDSHRRCYRRPHSHSILPCNQNDLDGGHNEGSSTRRSRREFHRHHHRGVTGTHHHHESSSHRHHLPHHHHHHHHHYHPHDTSTVIPEEFCQPPPPYETIQPPTYDETVLRDPSRATEEMSNVVNTSVNNDNNTNAVIISTGNDNSNVTIPNSNSDTNTGSRSIQQLTTAETK